MLVESPDDINAIVGLARHRIPNWPPSGNTDYPVYIHNGGGVTNILKRGVIQTYLKEPGLTIFGIMLDADDDCLRRYSAVRNLCESQFPSMPSVLPESGAIADNGDMRLGVWIMPDNKGPGMLETFCQYMIPENRQPVWTHAQQSFGAARTLGAPCRPNHTPKAHLYTWLAWQDPPGKPIGAAIANKILDPYASAAEPFMKWFKELYGV